MFGYVTFSRKLFALFFSIAMVQTVLAVSPWPSGYQVVAKNGKCSCRYGFVYRDLDSRCQCYVDTSNQCHVSCPTGTSSVNSRKRRQLEFNEDGSISNCPNGQTSCPITNAHGSHHECVNTKSDLDNCGGCAATGHGTVCGRESGVRTASCDGGICYIHSCRSGYRLDMHEQECVVKH